MESAPRTPATALRTRPRPATSRTALETPATSVRRAPASLLPAPSSASYSSTLRSRQALHGVEGSIVLDLGSRVWKVGFSGEEGPRDCLRVPALSEGAEQELGIWGLESYALEDAGWRVREERLKRGLRAVWFESVPPRPLATLCADALHSSAYSRVIPKRARSFSSRIRSSRLASRK